MTSREWTGRTATVIVMVLLAWLLLRFLVHVVDVLILLLIASIFAAGLSPLVSALERRALPGDRRLPAGIAILAIYLVTFLVFAGLLSVIIVPAIAEGRAFIANLPQFLAALQEWNVQLRARLPWLPNVSSSLNQIPHDVTNLSRYGSTAAGVASFFVGGVGGLFAMLVLTFYMLLEGATMKASFLGLFPPDSRARVELVLLEIGAKFGGWLRAQLLLSAVVAAIVTIGMLAVGMPFPSLIGIVAGLGELVPLLGPTLSAVVAVLIGLSQPLWRLVAVVIFYVIVMNVEPHILVPRIMSRAVGISPLLALVALLSGIELTGILGGLLAIPVAAALQVVVSEIARAIQPVAVVSATEAAPPGAGRTPPP